MCVRASVAFAAPGASTTVLLTIPAAKLGVVDDAGRRWLKPATFTVRVGDVLEPAVASFTVRGQPVLLEDLSAMLS